MPFKSYGPVVYWRPGIREMLRHRFTKNVGDELGPEIVRAILAERQLTVETWRNDAKRLLVVGSILQLAHSGDVVWGVGLRGAETQAQIPDQLDVRALRGPLTAEALRKQTGLDCSVFGDPGLLLPNFIDMSRFDTAQPKKDVILLSHFGDTRRFNDIETVRMTGSINKVVQAILSADVVIASALHGIIMAEAFGKPTVWLSDLHREPTFKYLDYYAGTGRDNPLRTSDILKWNDYVNPPPKFAKDALLNSFPYDCFTAS